MLFHYYFYLEFQDPKENTAIQRTWHNRKDPAIKAIQDLGVDNTKKILLPKFDNCLSLPIDDEKTYSNIRSRTRESNCYRTSTEITKRAIKVFNLRSNIK